MLTAVAMAATQWHVFDIFHYMTGNDPVNAASVMQSNLYSGTVNDVKIDVRECGYDGKQLFMEYSFTLPGYDRVLTEEDGLYEIVRPYGVDWWCDSIWFNGVGMNMPNNSSEERTPGANNGEVIVSQNWRLDNEGVVLNGPTEIILPIGKAIEDQDYYQRSIHPEHWDENSERIAPPEGTGVRFTFDPGDVSAMIKTEHPRYAARFDEVTISVDEVVYTPIMTYITYKMSPNLEVLAKYMEEHGIGQRDEYGKLMFPYTGVNVYGEWVSQMALVDKDGKQLFPDFLGNNGCSDTWAEFDYPYMENPPEELYMAYVDQNGNVDMTKSVRVK